MNECDIFKARLANIVIDFGHIPTWRLKAFAKFCIKHGLIHQPPGYACGAYKVGHEYKYACTRSKVSHLPLGWAFVLWHEIIEYKNFGSSNPPQNDYVSYSNIHVKPHGGRPNYDYVTYYQGIVY